MDTKLKDKYIQDLIWRKNQEVIEIMKTIPNGELFSWKGDCKLI